MNKKIKIIELLNNIEETLELLQMLNIDIKEWLEDE